LSRETKEEVSENERVKFGRRLGMQGWGREVMDARCEGNLEESMWRL